MLKPVVRDILLWLFWSPFRTMTSLLPIRTVYRMGIAGGWLRKITGKKRRHRTFNEITATPAFSGVDTKMAVDRAFQVSFLNEIETFLYPRFNKENIGEFTNIEGEEHLKNALSSGKGVMLVHAHFGNPQMLMSGLGHKGFKINQIGRSPLEDLEDVVGGKPSSLFIRSMQIRDMLERTLPANIIYLSQSPRQAFEAIKKGGILAIAIDGGGGKNRIGVDFLGRKASFSAGPFSLALKTGAVALPLFVVREKPWFNKIIIGKPFDVINTGNYEDDVIRNTQKFADLMTEYVKMYPCHYVWLFGYKRRYFVD